MDAAVLKLLGTRCRWEPQGVENGNPQALEEPGMRVGVSSLALSARSMEYQGASMADLGVALYG